MPYVVNHYCCTSAAGLCTHCRQQSAALEATGWRGHRTATTTTNDAIALGLAAARELRQMAQGALVINGTDEVLDLQAARRQYDVPARRALPPELVTNADAVNRGWGDGEAGLPAAPVDFVPSGGRPRQWQGFVSHD